LPGKGDRTAATIMVVALSMAVAWGADSAVIAEIVPWLKCFLKQDIRDGHEIMRIKMKLLMV
jgi:hypothetical protein